MTSKNIDILTIHDRIQKDLRKIMRDAPQIKKQIDRYRKRSKLEPKNRTFTDAIAQLTDRYTKAVSGQYEAYYLLRTRNIVNEFRKVVNCAVEYTIDGYVTPDTRTRLSQRDNLVSQFIQVAKDYLTIIDIPDDSRDRCPDCKNAFSKNDLIDDSYLTCERCGIVVFTYCSNNFWDKNRANNGGHYVYYKGINFQDAIKQYQGVEPKKIKPEIYEIIDRDIRCLYPNIKNKEMVSRGLIKKILQRNGFSHYFENIQKIFCTYVNRPPPNISHLVVSLTIRFHKIEKIYKKYTGDRASFLGSQFVLYQCLRLEGWKCHEEEFDIIDDSDGRNIHRKAWAGMTKELDWPYYDIL